MRSRLGPILWFTAAGLALAAALIAYSRQGEIQWALIGATAFLAAMGFSALRRSKPAGSEAKTR